MPLHINTSFNETFHVVHEVVIALDNNTGNLSVLQPGTYHTAKMAQTRGTTLFHSLSYGNNMFNQSRGGYFQFS